MRDGHFIHVGLHKTASTFLQNVLFPTYFKQYRSLRLEEKIFLDYVINENDITFDPCTACQLLNRQPKILISDEIFCGAPWNDAKDRARYTHRLSQTFENPHFILILRNQEDITESLYLEYIKKGGAASWKQFLNHDRFALSFSRGSYLDYSNYVNLLKNVAGQKRVLVLYYEDLIHNPTSFVSNIFRYLDESPPNNNDLYATLRARSNKSIRGLNAQLLRWVNKLCASEREPFQLVPRPSQSLVASFLRRLPQPGGRLIPKSELKAFCYHYKHKNHLLPEYERIKHYGY